MKNFLLLVTTITSILTINLTFAGQGSSTIAKNEAMYNLNIEFTVQNNTDHDFYLKEVSGFPENVTAMMYFEGSDLNSGLTNLPNIKKYKQEVMFKPKGSISLNFGYIVDLVFEDEEAFKKAQATRGNLVFVSKSDKEVGFTVVISPIKYLKEEGEMIVYYPSTQISGNKIYAQQLAYNGVYTTYFSIYGESNYPEFNKKVDLKNQSVPTQISQNQYSG